MIVSASVMAHPKRKVAAEALAEQLKQMPFVAVSVSFDTPEAGSHQEEWDNGKRALQAGIGKADWHVVIQDDAILTPFFFENLIGALENVPSKSLVSLYTGKPRPMPKRIKPAVDKARDGDWLSFWMLLWGVCIAIPSSHIEPMLDFVDTKLYSDTQYDNRIGMFYNRNRLEVYYTMPSLVDHNEDMGSLLEGHGTTEEPRVAHRLATGNVRWSNKVILI